MLRRSMFDACLGSKAPHQWCKQRLQEFNELQWSTVGSGVTCDQS